MFKRLKYIAEFTLHFILHNFFTTKLRLYSSKWSLQNKNVLVKMREISDKNNPLVRLTEFENNRYLEIHEMISRYLNGILKQARIIADLIYNNHQRVIQKKDKLTITIRKIRNILQSKYRYIKYEKFRNSS